MQSYAQIKGFYDGNTYFEEEVNRNPPLKKSNQLSLYFGLSNYLGDLGGNNGMGKKFFYDNNLKKRTFFYGVSFTHYRKEAIGIRFNYSSGKIAGSDQDAAYQSTTDDAYNRYKRNLDFQSKISEGSILLEVFPFKFIPYKHALHQWNFQPYLMIGLGIYSFNPQGSYFDEISDDYVWVDLQPLRTEGQGMKEYPNRKPYKLSQSNMPFGFGLKYNMSDKTSIGFEFVGRKLFTDYLDDVSEKYIDPSLFPTYLSAENAEIAQIIHNKSNVIDPDNPYGVGDIRGNPKNNDFYYSFNLKFSIRISKVKNVTRMFKKKIYKYDNDEICY
jgi:hypothetical protein